MTSWRGLAALAAAVAVLGAAELSARASTPNVSASRYDVVLDLQPDGSLDVVERITLAVGSKPITWFERRVPDRRTDGLINVVALMDGRVVPIVESGPGVRIRQRRGIDARWEFEPTSNRTRVFELRYRAVRVVPRGIDGPHFKWTALPERHDYPIVAAEVRLRAPEGTLASAVEARGGDIQASASWQDGLVVTREGIGRDRTITVDVMFAPATMAPAEPDWFVAAAQAQKMVPAFVAAGLILLVIGFGTLAMIAARNRRPAVADEGSVPLAEEQDDAPAVASVLLNRGHSVGWLSLQAAFFRLVREGQLVVEKRSAGGWFRRRAFAVTLGAAGSTRPHEQWILDGVAREGGAADLRHLTSRFVRRQQGFRDTVRAEALEQGLLDSDRLATARGLLIAGLVLMGLSLGAALVVVIFFVDRLGPALLAIPGAVCVDGLTMIIGSRGISLLSDTGMREAARWRARLVMLKQIIRQGADGQSLQDFERWLPLAIGASLGGRWLKTFDAQLRTSGTEIAWLKTMGSPEDVRASIAMMVAISGASHSGGGGGADGGAGGGSSGAG